MPGVLGGDNNVLDRRTALPRRAHPVLHRGGQHIRELAQRQHQASPSHREVGAHRAALLRALDPHQRGRLRLG